MNTDKYTKEDWKEWNDEYWIRLKRLEKTMVIPDDLEFSYYLGENGACRDGRYYVKTDEGEIILRDAFELLPQLHLDIEKRKIKMKYYENPEGITIADIIRETDGWCVADTKIVRSNSFRKDATPERSDCISEIYDDGYGKATIISDINKKHETTIQLDTMIATIPHNCILEQESDSGLGFNNFTEMLYDNNYIILIS